MKSLFILLPKISDIKCTNNKLEINSNSSFQQFLFCFLNIYWIYLVSLLFRIATEITSKAQNPQRVQKKQAGRWLNTKSMEVYSLYRYRVGACQRTCPLGEFSFPLFFFFFGVCGIGGEEGRLRQEISHAMVINGPARASGTLYVTPLVYLWHIDHNDLGNLLDCLIKTLTRVTH